MVQCIHCLLVYICGRWVHTKSKDNRSGAVMGGGRHNNRDAAVRSSKCEICGGQQNGMRHERVTQLSFEL